MTGAEDDTGERPSVGFRLVQPSGKLGQVVTGQRLPRQFTATLLLGENAELDVEAVAATATMRFPAIGRIDALPPPTPGAAGAVTVDGALVTLQHLPMRVPSDKLTPPLRTLRSWDADAAIRGHVAAIEIGCGGELPGLEGAEAYAAAVHFVAAAACQVVPARAVLWREGWAITQPRTFAECADRILQGQMPLAAWVSFATVVPKGYEPEDATGMVTYGMRAFVGRELELAPRPCSAREAYRCLSRVAKIALDRGLALEDGQRLSDPQGGFSLTVRERNFWLRRDQSAFVLVADDSIVDIETLRPRGEVA